MDNNIKANRLSETIERSGYKKKDFARMTNITPNTLSRFLNGADISANYLSRVSAAFGVSLPYLLGEIDVRSENNQTTTSLMTANKEAYKLKSIEMYISTMGVRIERTIIIGDNHFRSTKRGWLELGSQGEYDDLEMKKLILDSNDDKVKYIVSIEYGDSIKTMNYNEYVAWAQGLINLTHMYVRNGLFHQSSEGIKDDILAQAIQEKQGMV